MTLQLAETETDFENINQFFWKMWKEEFDLDRYDRIEEYKNSIVVFIEKEQKIIWAISITIYNWDWIIWRFWVEASYRETGLWKKLFFKIEEEIQKKNIKILRTFAEINKIPMYEHFGFAKIWEIQKFGNTESVIMEKKYF